MKLPCPDLKTDFEPHLLHRKCRQIIGEKGVREST